MRVGTKYNIISYATCADGVELAQMRGGTQGAIFMCYK